MTMHRLFNDRVKPYILIDVKTNSEESLCAKKLFLYEFLLSMLSHMNYIHIHSDNSTQCLLQKSSFSSLLKKHFIMNTLTFKTVENDLCFLWIV